ncbi:MAG: AraC family transcriptional regulator [Wenzhouxiangella sp.]|nr:AraC family transcriptional regulator [Wenzhouxiangella sp.]
MNPVAKALWFIESHLHKPQDLEQIAAAACVSRFHLCRVFAAVTGMSVMGYVRVRRLELAARYLQESSQARLLEIALDCGYGSHQAFTRAFGDHFGIAPSDFRRQPLTFQSTQVEVSRMSKDALESIRPVRFENLDAFTVVGSCQRYTWQSDDGIPGQWARFAPRIDSIAGRSGEASYGGCFDSDDEGAFNYLCGVAVAPGKHPPSDLDQVGIPSARYAVFFHAGHVSGLKETIKTIWNHWLPNSGFQPAGTPDFERYDDRFDPQTGFGGVEIWVPMKMD